MKDTCATCRYSALCFSEGLKEVVFKLMLRESFVVSTAGFSEALKRHIPYCKHAPFAVHYDGSRITKPAILNVGILYVYDRTGKLVLEVDIRVSE